MSLKFDPDHPLYTIDEKAWKIEQLAAVFDQLVEHGKPVVIFVHGRGKEPRKSLQGAHWVRGLAVPKIELGYDTSVLMFNWDSAFPFLQFTDRELPLSKTEAGAESFCTFLNALKNYQSSHPTFKPTLVAHSMGSIVVQKAVSSKNWPQGGTALFRQVLLTEPDADDVGHAAWLDKLGKLEKVYVTWNNDDKVLLKSTNQRPPGRHALGLGTAEKLSQSVKYVDLSRMGAIGSVQDDDHEVFGKGAMNGQIFVCRFFTQAIRGEEVVLDPIVNIEAIDRKVVYKLKSKFEPDAPCLKQPILPTKYLNAPTSDH